MIRNYQEIPTSTQELVSVMPTDKDSSPSGSGCNECDQLQEEFKKNPGGKPISNFGRVVVAVTGENTFPYLNENN